MSDNQHQEWSSQMRDHERRVAELSQVLASIQGQHVPRAHHEVIFLTAQVMKHRISMALLASRLNAVVPLQQ